MGGRAAEVRETGGSNKQGKLKKVLETFYHPCSVTHGYQSRSFIDFWSASKFDQRCVRFYSRIKKDRFSVAAVNSMSSSVVLKKGRKFSHKSDVPAGIQKHSSVHIDPD